MGINAIDADLFDAAQFGDLDWIQQSISGVGLSEDTINFDAQDNNGETVLRVASKQKLTEITQGIIGAFYHMHNALGYGFLEKVYEHASYKTLYPTKL